MNVFSCIFLQYYLHSLIAVSGAWYLTSHAQVAIAVIWILSVFIVIACVVLFIYYHVIEHRQSQSLPASCDPRAGCNTIEEATYDCREKAPNENQNGSGTPSLPQRQKRIKRHRPIIFRPDQRGSALPPSVDNQQCSPLWEFNYPGPSPYSVTCLNITNQESAVTAEIQASVHQYPEETLSDTYASIQIPDRPLPDVPPSDLPVDSPPPLPTTEPPEWPGTLHPLSVRARHGVQRRSGSRRGDDPDEGDPWAIPYLQPIQVRRMMGRELACKEVVYSGYGGQLQQIQEEGIRIQGGGAGDTIQNVEGRKKEQRGDLSDHSNDQVDYREEEDENEEEEQEDTEEEGEEEEEEQEEKEEEEEEQGNENYYYYDDENEFNNGDDLNGDDDNDNNEPRTNSFGDGSSDYNDRLETDDNNYDGYNDDADDDGNYDEANSKEKETNGSRVSDLFSRSEPRVQTDRMRQGHEGHGGLIRMATPPMFGVEYLV